MPEASSEAAAMIINAHRAIVTAELKGANSILSEILANGRCMVEHGTYTQGDVAIEIDALENAVDEGLQALKDTFGRYRGAGA